ncbi:TIGR04500 family putative peptide maturation system protein [Nonomuraea zeae]|uniref:TIGR04500 family putative peptide maturation system protein n=1 Tax=Nonomuraea zeae TaxID=1642303 RepID=A0A5S4GJ72_9ACTN|nr:TIGR04500 family putative peptide maturation system protein [Nonomuraea zeae]TMR32601.1 TIGR04500 family putative peptide maturation system protein [Nonomuraea zeae]
MTDGPMLADAVGLLSSGTPAHGLEAFRAAYPHARTRLVAQREEFDGSLHHALLIKDGAGAAISLSWCPDRALPWPLRGVHRAGEHLLLRVNGIDTPVARAIACLDFIWDESALADRLVSDSLVREELAQAREPLSDAALQEAMDAFRRARGLLTGAATRAWMERHRISHHELEELVALEAAVAALRSRVAAGRVESWFAEHGRQLDVARVARAEFVTEPVVPDPAGFLDAVERAFADGTARPGEVFATLRRGDLGEEMAERIFTAPPGTVAGPFKSEHGHLLVKVLAVEPAVLDETVRDLVERRIFRDWIERRRSTAKIEWFWGLAERTAGRGR